MSDFYKSLVDAPGWKEGEAEAERLVIFGNKLRQVREELQLSQTELARLARVDQGDISRFELGKWGKRGISYEMLDRILPVLGLRLEHRVTPATNARPSPLTAEAVQIMSAML